MTYLNDNYERNLKNGYELDDPYFYHELFLSSFDKAY